MVMYDFFFSHSSRLDTRTNRFIRAVAAHLKRCGRKVFLDASNLEEGASLGTTIRAAIEAARVGVVVHTPASAQSRWVEYELTKMIEQRVRHATNIWWLCLPSCGGLPAWVEAADALWIDDYRDPEHVAEELLSRYKKLDC